MVCHETYKDKNGNWLSPDEINKTDANNAVSKTDNTKVFIGPRSQCQNRKKIQLILKL